MPQTTDQSVEAILESIKKVIARDNRTVAQDERERRETAGIVYPARNAGHTLRLLPDPDPAEEPYMLDVEEAPEDEEGVLDLAAGGAPFLATAEEPAAEAESLIAGVAAVTPPSADATPVAPEEFVASVSLDKTVLQDINAAAAEEAALAVQESLAVSATEAPTPTASARSEAADFATIPDTSSAEPVSAGPVEALPLEGLVRQMLRPMLAEWIEANLPTIVEQMVKAEFDRIAMVRP